MRVTLHRGHKMLDFLIPILWWLSIEQTEKIKLYVRKQMITQNQKSININVEELIYCLKHFCSQKIFVHDLKKLAELLSRKKSYLDKVLFFLKKLLSTYHLRLF